MKKQAEWKHHKKRDSRIGKNSLGVFITFSLMLTLGVGILFSGCAIGVNHFQHSFDISQQFEKGEIIPGYRYYVSGPEWKPLAIVAISADYHLQSEYWRGIDVNNASLKALVERISFVLYSEYKEVQMIPNGARIIGPDGAVVGMWYSVYDYCQVTFLPDKVIYLSPAIARMPPDVHIPRD